MTQERMRPEDAGTSTPSPRVACGECEGGWLEESKTNPGVWGCLKCGRIAPRPFQIGDRVRRVNKDNTRRVPIGSTGTVNGAGLWIRVEWDHDPNLGDPECNCTTENLQLIPNEPEVEAAESNADHRVRLEMKRADKAERLLSESVRQLVEAEARVKELDNRLVIAEAWRNDAALGLGEKRNKRITELEQWQWDNMKKWLGIIGWGSMTPTQPECPTLIDAALQQGVEDAKRVETLEGKLKELEEQMSQAANVERERIRREISFQFQPKGYIKTATLLKILGA